MNLFFFFFSKETNISNYQHDDDNEDAKREQHLNNHKEIIYKLLMGKSGKTKNNPINCCWSSFSLTFCNWWMYSFVLFICGSFSSSSCQTSALSNTKERLITWSSYWILAQTYNVVLLNILGRVSSSRWTRLQLWTCSTCVCLAGDEKQQEQSQRPPDDRR